jgi:hypothetical protein
MAKIEPGRIPWSPETNKLGFAKLNEFLQTETDPAAVLQRFRTAIVRPGYNRLSTERRQPLEPIPRPRWFAQFYSPPHRGPAFPDLPEALCRISKHVRSFAQSP